MQLLPILITEYFYRSKKKPILPNYPLVTMNLVSFSIDLPIMGISFKSNHTVYSLLCLSSFTYHNILKVYPCRSTYLCFITFYCQKTFYCMDIPFPVDRYLNYFYFLTIRNNVAINIHLQVLCETYIFSSLESIPRNRVAELW